MKLILAGDYIQARNYMVEHRLSQRDARYIASRDSIRGIENPEVIKVGTWQERHDIDEILLQIKVMTRGPA